MSGVTLPSRTICPIVRSEPPASATPHKYKVTQPATPIYQTKYHVLDHESGETQLPTLRLTNLPRAMPKRMAQGTLPSDRGAMPIEGG